MARSARRNQKNDKSLVPILFTIGVIGWGFFAIDRILAPPVDLSEKKNVKSQKYDAPNGFKAWLLKIIESKSDSKITATRNIPREVISPSRLEVLPEDPIADFGLKAERQKIQQVKIFLYALDKNGDLTLKTLNREVPFEDVVGSALQEVINGPTSNEERKNIIDSFPAKPMILGIQKNQKTLVLNLDDQFGVGISFQSLKLQLKQLWKTASQFGIEALKIRINGQDVKHLGGDGAPLPSVITAVTFAKS